MDVALEDQEVTLAAFNISWHAAIVSHQHLPMMCDLLRFNLEVVCVGSGGGSLRTKTLILTAFVSNAVGGVGYKLATVRDLMPFPRGRRQGAEPLQFKACDQTLCDQTRAARLQGWTSAGFEKAFRSSWHLQSQSQRHVATAARSCRSSPVDPGPAR